jgi:5-methylthioadenosine/S-adenosylhomocysteine deaminase
VIHCPVSNAVIASGVAPVSKLQQYGIKVFLGTDGPASNDTQDLFETIKWTLGLARVTTLNPAALTPTQVLDMATAGTRLQPGGLADIILVNLNTNRAMPVHDVTSALVLSTNGSDVDTVIVGGIVLLSQKRLQVLDLETLLDECRSAANALKRRAGVG